MIGFKSFLSVLGFLFLNFNISAQPTENILTAPSAKGMNNTSLIASTDNTNNNNPPTSTLELHVPYSLMANTLCYETELIPIDEKSGLY